MNDVHVNDIDLNLLVALDALIRERSVTRAARRVGVTQSAMSHALGRLRERLGDPLFVRGPAGMLPTPRAEALAAPIARTMAGIRDVFAPARFDPMTASGEIRFGTSDYGAFVLLPAFADLLRREAPGLDLHVLPVTEDGASDLASGLVDIAISRPGPDGLHHEVLFDDVFLCVLRAGHPAADGLDLDAFLAWPHVLVAPRGRTGGVVDTVLAERGLSRRVSVLLPHFLVAPHIVASTDCILTLASRVACRVAEPLGLVLRPLPLPLPRFGIAMLWHERTEQDAALRWARGRLRAVAAALGRA